MDALIYIKGSRAEPCLLVSEHRPGLSAPGSPGAETLAGGSCLTLPPSLLPATKGLLGFPKHVICSTTARHCYLQASRCRAGRAVAGRARGRGETRTHDRGWQPARNLRTCLLLEWENYFSTYSESRPWFLGLFLTSTSQYHLLERRLRRELGQVSQSDRGRTSPRYHHLSICTTRIAMPISPSSLDYCEDKYAKVLSFQKTDAMFI